MSTKRPAASSYAGYETLEQAAARIGYSVSTIRRYIASGHLTSVLIFGRRVVSAAEVDRLPKRGEP